LKGICPFRNETVLNKVTKLKLQKIVLKDDKSSEAEKMRLFCKYSLPEAETKAEAWKIITGKNSTLSKKMIEEVIQAFNQPNQLDLTN